MDTRVVKGPAGNLHVDVRGSGGVPVVFVPSLAGNTRQWERQLAHLARQRQAVAIDLRGHGKSDAPAAEAFQPQDYARDIRAVLDALNIPQAVLVGHSMGSAAVIAFAGDHPSRVGGLLLVDPVDDASKRPPDPGFEAFLERLAGGDYAVVIEGYWKQILANASPEVTSAVLADLRATPQRTVVGSMRGLERFNPSGALAAFRGPIMSVTSHLNDFPSSLHVVYPRLRHQRLTGVSHWLHLDRPDEFNRILDEFLAEVGPTKGA